MARALKGGSAPPPPLLEYRRFSPDWINWAVWRQRHPDPVIADLPVEPCSSYARTIGLALEGKGVALGSLPMLAHEIASGALRRVSAGSLHTGKAYWLARPEGLAPRGVMDAWQALTKPEGAAQDG